MSRDPTVTEVVVKAALRAAAQVGAASYAARNKLSAQATVLVMTVAKVIAEGFAQWLIDATAS